MQSDVVAWGGDDWYGHPGQQDAGGGKMSVLNLKKIDFLRSTNIKFLSQVEGS